MAARQAERGSRREGELRRARAPGRVNLIGDHTDYCGGLALPMAIQLEVTVELRPADSSLLKVSSMGSSTLVDLASHSPASDGPAWARLVAELARLAGWRQGGSATVTSSLPPGAGLASSAAFEVAMALVMGLGGDPLALARQCQQAEQAALGVPCGLMDQLASAAGVAGHALLIDFATTSVRPVPIPEAAEFFVVDSGQPRSLAGSGYAERRAQCEAAAAAVGPLPAATAEDLARIADPLVRRRARHVASESDRVRQAAAALSRGDLDALGQLMVESHRSLALDFEVSTPALDAVVSAALARPGVKGARMTGAGFGGCAVVLAERGAVRPQDLPGRARPVWPSAGASLEVLGEAPA